MSAPQAWWQRLSRWLHPPERARRPVPAPTADDASPLEPVALPLDGELDLHTFRPAEVAALVEDYVEACQQAGVLSLRIVHGKGKGSLRRTVHARLGRLAAVAHFGLAPPERGGWGATLVDLHPRRNERPPESDG